jgi:glutathione synthase/RimK-type ligase-like ATP-grasp enzyme
LSNWMVPHTTVITRRQGLLQVVNRYHSHGIKAVVTKQDQMHCGHGLRRWSELEILYNCLGFCPDAYPFVLQPYVENCRDVRVIVVGSYVEAYLRSNPHNFRQNLAAGGFSSAYAVDAELEGFCRAVMARGKFPYAHLDVLFTDDGCCWLSEISLEAGIKGAEISRKQLAQKKQQVLDELLAQPKG